MHVLTVESIVSVLDVEILVLELGHSVQPRALVSLPEQALKDVFFDWHADVEVVEVVDGDTSVLVRGTVQSAALDPSGSIVLDIVSWPDLLNDARISEVVVKAAPRADVAWSVMMTAGIDPSSLSVDGAADLPPEFFKVIAPVFGLRVAEPIAVGSTQLIPRPDDLSPILGDVPPTLAGRFDQCSGLAVATVEATTLFGAERLGLAHIDYAVGVALLNQRLALGDIERVASEPYQRDSAIAVVRRGQTVAVRGRWGREWTRDTDLVEAPEEFHQSLRPLRRNLAHFFQAPETLRLAVNAWTRAVQALDGVEIVIELWNSLEFYAAGATVAADFTKSELSVVADQAVEGLDAHKAERIRGAIRHVNSAPLMARIQSVAAADGTALTDGDWSVLKSIRRFRNGLVHGRSTAPPPRGEIRKGISIVNRLLYGALIKAHLNETHDSETLGPTASPTDRLPSQTFTVAIKRYAELAAEAMMLMLPYVERAELVPGAVQSRIRDMYVREHPDAFPAGTMRAVDVALKHLASHFADGSIQIAASRVAERLRRLSEDDQAGLGDQAYEDGAVAINRMSEAMLERRRIEIIDDLPTENRIVSAFNACLFALLYELAESYGMPPSRAAAHLGMEIATIIPHDQD